MKRTMHINDFVFYSNLEDTLIMLRIIAPGEQFCGSIKIEPFMARNRK